MVQIKEFVIFSLFFIIHLTVVLFWEISWQMLNFIIWLLVLKLLFLKYHFVFVFLTRVMFTGGNKYGVSCEIQKTSFVNIPTSGKGT